MEKQPSLPGEYGIIYATAEAGTAIIFTAIGTATAIHEMEAAILTYRS